MFLNPKALCGSSPRLIANVSEASYLGFYGHSINPFVILIISLFNDF